MKYQVQIKKNSKKKFVVHHVHARIKCQVQILKSKSSIVPVYKYSRALTFESLYQNVPMAAAIDEVILNVLPPETGGMIGVDSQGNKN
jgi:hypothetical protein